MISRENAYAAGILAAGLVLGCTAFAAWGPVEAAEPLPAVTLTATVTMPPRTIAVTERASRSSVRIPRRLGNDIERADPKRQLKLNSPAKRYAATLVSHAQMRCLLPLWHAESGWSPTALGPVTKNGRAYGIAQSMGMRPGTPWRTQVRLGVKYIKHRYGTPCRALAHHHRKNWY